jgi:hypothetical protein
MPIEMRVVGLTSQRMCSRSTASIVEVRQFCAGGFVRGVSVKEKIKVEKRQFGGQQFRES